MLFRLIRHVIIRNTHTWIEPKGHNTGITVYNTILGENVPFITEKKGLVTWYTCGPTVYDSAHIGHAMCYVKLDIIQRILRDVFKLNVVTIMNITDIDDKIIAKANSTKMNYKDLTRQYEKEFLTDLKKLNIEKPSQVVRVTDHIEVIIDYIEALLSNNHAYTAKDGSTYFDVDGYKNYGKLRKVATDDKVKHDPIKSIKKNALDFALWKAAKEGEPYWKAPFGIGRPGWHIECSALASATLGSSIDVHAGGIDLCFPHHENEEAQSCAYYNKPQWVNYWLHPGHLIIKHNKMSKSLGNTIYISDFLTHHSSDVLRMACLLSPYKHNMEYSVDMLKLAEANLNVFNNFIHLCRDFLEGKIFGKLDNDLLYNTLQLATENVHTSLANDFDTTNVIKILQNLVNTVNKMINMNNNCDTVLSDSTQLIAVSNYVKGILNTFGLTLENATNMSSVISESNIELTDLLVKFRSDIRMIAKSDKNDTVLKLCDAVRIDADKCGIRIKDFKNESSWSKC